MICKACATSDDSVTYNEVIGPRHPTAYQCIEVLRKRMDEATDAPKPADARCRWTKDSEQRDMAHHECCKAVIAQSRRFAAILAEIDGLAIPYRILTPGALSATLGVIRAAAEGRS